MIKIMPKDFKTYVLETVGKHGMYFGKYIDDITHNSKRGTNRRIYIKTKSGETIELKNDRSITGAVTKYINAQKKAEKPSLPAKEKVPARVTRVRKVTGQPAPESKEPIIVSYDKELESKPLRPLKSQVPKKRKYSPPKGEDVHIREPLNPEPTKKKPRSNYVLPFASRIAEPQDVAQAVAEIVKNDPDMPPAIASAMVEGEPVVQVQPPTIPVSTPKIEHSTSGLLPPVDHMDVVIDGSQKTDQPRPFDHEIHTEQTFVQNNQQNLFQQNQMFIQQNLAEWKPEIEQLSQFVINQNLSQAQAQTEFRRGLEYISDQVKNGNNNVYDVVQSYESQLQNEIIANREAMENVEMSNVKTQNAIQQLTEEVRGMPQKFVFGQPYTEDSIRQQMNNVAKATDPHGNSNEPSETLKVLNDIKNLLTQKNRKGLNFDEISIPMSLTPVPRYRKNRFANPSPVQKENYIVYPSEPKVVTVREGHKGHFEKDDLPSK